MGGVTMEQASDEAMERIRHLAATRRHRLAKDMTGAKRLSVIQAQMVTTKLLSCPPAQAEVAEDNDVKPQGGGSRETDPAIPPGLPFFKGRVPAGYFATPGAEAIDFWLVDVPADGKWEGFSFVRRVLGGPITQRKLRSVPITNMQQRSALQAILAHGVQEASDLFADTLTRCIDCSTPLTDPVSRAERRGPHCRSKKK